MNTLQPRQAERDQPTMDLVVAFLEDRLEEKETIEWALGLDPDDSLKRQAILHLLDGPWPVTLGEPWHSAWQLIKESWQGETDDRNRTPPVGIKQRLHSGEHPAALISAIVKLVAPRLAVEPYESWERQLYDIPKRPKSFRDLFRAKLVSGNVVNPVSLGLQEITESEFINSLAKELDTVVMRGLNIGKQIGLAPAHLLLHRVYYVPESERGDQIHEPDEFSRRIAASVKLLYAVVMQLFDVDRSAAFAFVRSWKRADSPIHLRLWAAMSCDSRITPASEVGDFLLDLNDRVFWDVNHHPEIAELRARRFSELDDATQREVIRRIRNKRPRKLWSKNAEADRIEEARRYWSVRELKRIEDAGVTLSRLDKSWMKTNIDRFSELTQMDRIDVEFSKFPNTQCVAGDPEQLLDYHDGVDRLRVMEQALAAPRPNWGDSQGDRAGDWIKRSDNSLRILEDFESSPDAGAEFPRTWELFGWEHRPPQDHNANTNGRDSLSEARRVLGLLGMMSGETMSKAIGGVSHWLSSWEKYVVKVPSWSAVWLRAWPIAVETTNGMHAPDDEPVFDASVQSNADQPYDLDIPNTPAGKLVDVFLAALDGFPKPFDCVGDLKRVRDQVINASGRSGLIAKHRMIESLRYFLFADREWTQEHLVRALREDNAAALALWGAVGRGIQSTDVLRVIGNDMANRSADNRLDRETRCSLAFSLVIESLHALREKRKPAVAQDRVQQMIRSLNDEVRAECARAITRFVRELSEASNQNSNPPSPEDLFRSSAKPFLGQVWPQERSLVSPGVSDRLATLPAVARGEFAEAVDTIERFLVPFNCWSMFDYGFGDDDQMATLEMIDDEAKAKALLYLLDRTVGTGENAAIPYDLGDALEQVRNVAPNLTRTIEYRRLETAASRA